MKKSELTNTITRYINHEIPFSELDDCCREWNAQIKKGKLCSECGKNIPEIGRICQPCLDYKEHQYT